MPSWPICLRILSKIRRHKERILADVGVCRVSALENGEAHINVIEPWLCELHLVSHLVSMFAESRADRVQCSAGGGVAVCRKNRIFQETGAGRARIHSSEPGQRICSKLGVV